jgi:hypothetical protein
MDFLRIVFTLTIFFLFAPTVLTQTTQLDIPSLIRECERNLRQYEGVYDYAFKQKQTIRFFDKSGELKKEEVEIFEAYPTRNRQNLVLVKLSENGVPLSPEKIAAGRKRAVKQIEEAERRKNSEPQSKTPNESGFVRLGFSDFLRAGEFSNPRRVRFRDRDAVILDFRPRVDFRPTTRMESVVSNLIGSIWIDVEKKQVMRLEARPSDNGYKTSSKPIGIIHPNAAFVMEQKLTPEGDWLLSLWHLDTVSRPALFNNTALNFTFEFSDFRRFNSNIENYEINEPKSKP